MVGLDPSGAVHTNNRKGVPSPFRRVFKQHPWFSDKVCLCPKVISGLSVYRTALNDCPTATTSFSIVTTRTSGSGHQHILNMRRILLALNSMSGDKWFDDVSGKASALEFERLEGAIIFLASEN